MSNPILVCPSCKCHLIVDLISDLFGYCCLNEACDRSIIVPEKNWFSKDGKRHREDGPAIELANGEKHWFLNGKRHRVDGPAIEYANGIKQWWVDGKWVPHQIEDTSSDNHFCWYGPIVEETIKNKMNHE